ncbi:MAG: M3 family oligoendopeptidase [Candidatus Thermoplasmatota archaeon]|nr:M3 family oligoendopeptidase [Candidatus Thermoplasmatota archaeon]
MNRVLPKDSNQMMDWSWDDYAPFFDYLENYGLTSENVSDWMKYWSDLSELIGEVGTSVYVSTTVDTADEEAKSRYHRFLDDISENVSSRNQILKIKLLDSELSPDNFEIPLRGMKSEVELFSEENLPLMTSDAKLSKEYDAIVGSQTVNWNDKEVTLTQLAPVMLETNRDKREKAWRLASDRRLKDRSEINKIWKKILKIRVSIAENSGHEDYRAWRWKYLKRFDYTPKDCLTFHNSIEKIIEPLADKLLQKRKEALGLAKLKPWDLSVDIFGRDPLVPFEDASELEEKCHNIFSSLDFELGNYFQVMREKSLLDLGNRKGKAPGGYCTEYPFQRLPFIFMNAVGTHSDVQTMIHEGGHAFHVFESADLPYASQRDVGMEFAEVASMAMELLASSYLSEKNGGFYSEEESARARIEHLEKIIMFWPYMAVVDAFQHWAYTNPTDAFDTGNCDKEWTKLWKRFQMSEHIDYSGCEDIISTGWHNKLHIYHVPFYYVEYGMAQLGAIQIWGNSLNNAKKAIQDYKAALGLGGNASLPELYEAAGAKFSFDDKTLKYAATLIEEQIQELS